MIPPLDLIALRNTESVWLCAAEDLKQALEIARHRGAGLYMVFSHQTEHKNYYEVTADGEVKLLDSAADCSSNGRRRPDKL
jgi:hypothetical protein